MSVQTISLARRAAWSLFAAVMLLGNLHSSSAAARTEDCPDLGTKFVLPMAIATGVPINCDAPTITVNGLSVTVPSKYCVTLVTLIPAHYEPIAKTGWRLTGKEKVPVLHIPHHCEYSYFLFVCTGSQCVGEDPIEQGFVWSWEEELCPATDRSKEE